MKLSRIADAIRTARRINQKIVENEKTLCGHLISTEELYLLVDAVLYYAKDHGDDAHDMAADIAVTSEANQRQVAGAHYGLSSYQHWDIVVQFKLDYFQGQITKYVMRWSKKNGVTDLEKAAHFLQKYIEEIKAERVKEA